VFYVEEHVFKHSTISCSTNVRHTSRKLIQIAVIWLQCQFSSLVINPFCLEKVRYFLNYNVGFKIHKLIYFGCYSWFHPSWIGFLGAVSQQILITPRFARFALVPSVYSLELMFCWWKKFFGDKNKLIIWIWARMLIFSHFDYGFWAVVFRYCSIQDWLVVL